MADHTVKEGQDCDVEVTYYDPDGAVVQPADAWWSLYDKDTRAVINSRENVNYTPGDSTEDIRLTTADNVIITSGRPMEYHTLEIKFELDDGTIGRDSFDFPVVDQINVA